MFGFADDPTFMWVAVAIFILDVVALIQVWRDTGRSTLMKVFWTAVIGFLPLLGGLGWLVNWLLGKAADQLDRRSAQH